MKLPFTLLLQLFIFIAMAQPAKQPTNVFIITTDGLRWQEVFNGANDSIIKDTLFVKDSILTNEMFGGSSPQEKRKKLMPFFWSTLATKGQLHGNRYYKNNVNVSNLYKVSYPGYNEILTGYADPMIMNNNPTINKNITLLEYLNTQQNYKGSVAVFSSWNVFPYIINEERSHILVNSGYENMKEESAVFTIINKVQDNVNEKEPTRYDQLTFLNAKEYIEKNHPKILMLNLGETDEFGHQRKYDLYLQQANNVDKMIAELWYKVQTDPFYKNNTIFIITTDHGRGSNPTNWYAHNLLKKGSGETWLAMIGPGIKPLGEMKTNKQLYQKQLAATITKLIDQKFEANHPIAEAFILPVSSSDQEPDANELGLLKNSILPVYNPKILLFIVAFIFLTTLVKRKKSGLIK